MASRPPQPLGHVGCFIRSSWIEVQITRCSPKARRVRSSWFAPVGCSPCGYGLNEGSRRFGSAFHRDGSLDIVTEYEWVPLVMAEDFHQKYVGIVAGIIGIVVLLLGLGGIYLTYAN